MRRNFRLFLVREGDPSGMERRGNEGTVLGKIGTSVSANTFPYISSTPVSGAREVERLWDVVAGAWATSARKRTRYEKEVDKEVAGITFTN